MNDMHIALRTLHAPGVSLEPVTVTLREELRRSLDVDPDSWNLQYVSGQGALFDAYFEAMMRSQRSGERLAFAVRLLKTGTIVGTSSFHHLSATNRTLEIGSTFLHPEVRGASVNPAIKLAMLEHAFASRALRVQLTVDSRNARSQAAVAKLGAVKEGVLRRHLVTWTGHKRDTVVFSILDDEWPAVRGRLLARLEAAG